MVSPSPDPRRSDDDDVRAHRLKNPGGTRGGALEFFISLAMVIGGGYLFMDRIIVTSNLGTLWGGGTFGLSLIPVFAGIAILFFNHRNIFGWILMLGGLLVIILGVIARLTIFYKPISFWHLLIILVLAGGGIGLI